MGWFFGAGLGWFVGGPLGAIVGAAIQSALSMGTQKQLRGSQGQTNAISASRIHVGHSPFAR